MCLFGSKTSRHLGNFHKMDFVWQPYRWIFIRHVRPPGPASPGPIQMPYCRTPTATNYERTYSSEETKQYYLVWRYGHNWGANMKQVCSYYVRAEVLGNWYHETLISYYLQLTNFDRSGAARPEHQRNKNSYHYVADRSGAVTYPARRSFFAYAKFFIELI